MPTQLNPYLNFRDNAAQAMAFYHDVFGGELQQMHFRDVPGTSPGPDEDDKIMHSSLQTPGGLVLMAADTPSTMEYRSVAGFSLSLSGEDEAELRGYWDKLADGANVLQPLSRAPWGAVFGMLVDRFETPWLFNINAPAAASG